MSCEPIPGVGGGSKKRMVAIEVFIYGVFLPAVLFTHPQRNSMSAYALAIFLSLSMVGTMIALAVMAARQTDEFQRKLLTQAMIWGIGGRSRSTRCRA